MTSMKKIIFVSPSYQKCRWMSLTSCCLRKKPTPVRDPSKRNFQGEKLEEYMRKRAEAIQALQPFNDALTEVIDRFKDEVKEKERQKHDIQGEMMKRELAERQQAVKNLTIIAKNNEDLRRQRELQRLICEDEAKREEQKTREVIRLEKEETKRRSTALVLQVIEESENFITFDNIDEKLELVLEKEVYFNYAITPDGKKIHSTKPPGNLDGWKGATPSAYIAGGIDAGSSEWNFVFKDTDTGFALKRGGLLSHSYFHKQNVHSEENREKSSSSSK